MIRSLTESCNCTFAGGTVEFALDAIFTFACHPDAPEPLPANHPLEHFDSLHSVLLGPCFVSGPHPLLNDAMAEKAAWERAAEPISYRTDYVTICQSMQPELPMVTLSVPKQQVVPPTLPRPVSQPLESMPPALKEYYMHEDSEWAKSHNTRPTGAVALSVVHTLAHSLATVGFENMAPPHRAALCAFFSRPCRH